MEILCLNSYYKIFVVLQTIQFRLCKGKYELYIIKETSVGIAK
jgi:hypothetical protein